MLNVIGDDARLALATEIRPGVMAGPWEQDRCQHGRIYSFRWVWRKDENIESSEPENRSSCKKCNPPDEEY